VALARPKPVAVAATAAASAVAAPLPQTAPSPRRAFVPGVLRPALPVPATLPIGTTLRRCTFRRMHLPLADGKRADYRVECLYAGFDAPEPLGDLFAARATCEACTRPGIFRADED
jgi:hypothetical protein